MASNNDILLRLRYHCLVNMMRDREDAIRAQLEALPDENLWNSRGRVVEAITRSLKVANDPSLVAQDSR